MAFYDVLENPRLTKTSCSQFEKSIIKENFPKGVIIRIFGFAGSGKGTLSHLLAKYLNIANVESSLILRALTYLYLELGLNSTYQNSEKIFALLNCVPNKNGELEVYYENNLLSKSLLKTPDIDKNVATYSGINYNRDLFYDKLISFLKLIGDSCILDGRGASTPYIREMEKSGRKIIRIFLDARDEVKAQRYYSAKIAKLKSEDPKFEESQEYKQHSLEEFISGILKRNAQDLATWSALDMGVITQDTVILDTSDMTPLESAETVLKYLGEELNLIKITN